MNSILKYILSILAVSVLTGLAVVYFSGSDVAPYVDIEQRLMFDNGETVSVEVVETPKERMRGLSGKRGLKPDNGMFFIFERPQNLSFWMRDMNFAIDMVWIRGNEVIGVTERVQPETFPERFHPPEPADRVLEIPAGDAERLDIGAGSTFRLRGI
jgi:uncharacterized membrane protein (UPF0127 family)